MKSLAETFPEFAASLARELERDGLTSAALAAPKTLVAKVTFDEVANAGYVYLHSVGTARKETLALETSPFSVVEIDASEGLLGIEFLSPPQAFADQLRRLAVV